MVVAYLTHPLGESDTEAAADTRRDNLANAISWFRFLVMATRWAISCPWFPYVAAIDEMSYRPRALRDQVELLHRSDVLVMAGGRVSPHMEILRNHARNRLEMPTPVLDLTDFGIPPPFNDLDGASLVIRARARALGL